MIVSQVLALYGLYDSDHVKNGPYGSWLLPAHMILYLIHMMQEIYDVHRSKTHFHTPMDDVTLKRRKSPRKRRSKSPAPTKKAKKNGVRGWSPGPRRGRPAEIRGTQHMRW